MTTGTTGDGPALYFADASLDGPVADTWWSARRIVSLAAPLLELVRHNKPDDDGIVRVWATVVYDLDPLDSGLDEYRWRHRDNQETVRIAVGDLLIPVQTATPDEDTEHGDLEDDETSNQRTQFRVARDTYRIAHGLPRHVIRSDIYDSAAQRRAPLHALRHPWPAGVFTQGGTASRPVELADDAPEPPDADVVTNRHSGKRVAIFRDRVFIEVFPPPTPDNPSGGLLRGTGATFTEAEDAAWAQWVAKQTCPAVVATGGHRWETRGYRNGAGFCAECNVFGSGVFDLVEIGSVCTICGDPYGDEIPEVAADGTLSRNRDAATMVCATHAPAGFSAIDAWLQTGRDDDGGFSPRPLTDDEKALVTDHVTPSDWRALDFNGRRALAARMRHAMLDRTRGRVS